MDKFFYYVIWMGLLFSEQLNVLELFLDCMTEPNERLVEFGTGGICNSCAGKLTLWFASLVLLEKMSKSFHLWEVIFMSLFWMKSFRVTTIWTDPSNAAVVTRCGGIPLVIQCLSSHVRNTVRKECINYYRVHDYIRCSTWMIELHIEIK